MPYADYQKTLDANRARQKTPRGAANHATANREWRRRNRDRLAAHNAVARALKSGAIVRQACERCGEIKTQAHHDDYTKQLDVRWLCDPHHKDRHRELKQASP
jgi:ribosomal protein S27AE